MSTDFPLVLLSPGDLRGDKAWSLNNSTWRLLAQGDSWFSIGHIPPMATGNILFNIRLPEIATAVSFAAPGKKFTQMVDWHREAMFLGVLAGGNLAYQWDAILLSAGGNDLFEALLTLPNEPDPGKASRRLLLARSERATGDEGDVSKYLRTDGWTKFFTLIVDCFVSLISKRDDADSKSPGIPIFVHTYDCPQPRWAPAGIFGPWLAKAFKEYEIPDTDWLPLTQRILQNWEQFLNKLNATLSTTRGISHPNVVTVHLRGTLKPAPAGSTGEIGDWENEIHPSYRGYATLGVAYESQIHIPRVNATSTPLHIAVSTA
jgi:hypothetical protein